MANYSIQTEYENTIPERIWDEVKQYIGIHKVFYSSRDHKEYKADIKDNSITFEGKDRSGEGLIIKIDFIKGFEGIKKLKKFNTSTIKGIIPNSLYIKRSPFIGLLLTSGIIKKIE